MSHDHASQSSPNPSSEREKLYLEYFGEPASASHELLPFNPHIDIYHYEPAGEREWHTYITSGMSDRVIEIPSPPSQVRIELIFYAAEHRQDYVDLLRYLARKPFENSQDWIWHGSTLVNGTPPKPFFANTPFTSLVFAGTIIPPESGLANELEIGGISVDPLWILPLFPKECEFIRRYDINQFIDKACESDFEFVYYDSRKELSFENWK